MAGVLIRDRGEKTKKTRRWPHEDGDRDGRDVATSPGMPGAPAPGRGRKDHPPEPPERAQPAHFWPPQLGENKFLLL